MLDEILKRHLSDQATHHSYGPLFNELFEPYKESAAAILEIGIENGCSLRAWREYFINAEIHGIDNAAHKMVQGEPRITTYHCDSTSRDAFISLAGRLPMFDIIVEDSSHIAVESLFIVAALWERVKPGGLIVVEDIAKPEYLAMFSAFKGATLHDRRKIRGQADDMLAVMRKPL